MWHVPVDGEHENAEKFPGNRCRFQAIHAHVNDSFPLLLLLLLLLTDL